MHGHTSSRRRRFARLLVQAVVAASWCGVAVPHRSPAAADSASGVDVQTPRLNRAIVVPDIGLSAGVRIGGLSDLFAAGKTGATGCFWTLTDRGPNGSVKIEGRTRRTILESSFVPSLVCCELRDATTAATDGADEFAVKKTLPLVTEAGRPLSGRPLPGLGDDAILDRSGREPVGPDPDGIDSEAVVEMADGTFWIAEEYGPSLLQVMADGRVSGRYVPVGTAPRGSVVRTHETLPAEYARRRENRGFEALAASADGTRLFALLQSPLDNPKAKAAKKTGNVRLLVFDPKAGRPVAEHVYRLGDPAEPGFLTRGVPPDDGKLCAIATVDDDSLLVLEQADGGLTRLYAASLTGATDTLGWRPANAEKGADARKTLEQVRDLEAAGIAPLRKTLVADLGGLLPEIEAFVYGGEPRSGTLRQLKLEGIAIVDERHVAIVNDNDFGVHAKEGEPAPRSCLFVIELADPLPRRVAVKDESSENVTP